MSLKLAIYTEDEARKMACCSGGHRPEENGPCIASRCMAWRWRATHIHGRGPDGEPALVPSGDTYGYCGLAGSPDGSATP